jgi:hypothetical protein
VWRAAAAPQSLLGPKAPQPLEKESLPMRLNKNLGMLLLSIWLILHALITLFDISFRGLYAIMAVLALVAGIVIVLFSNQSTAAP